MADNKRAADDRQTPNDEPKSMSAAAGAQFAPPNSDALSSQDVKAQRGGLQEDQLSGETQKGAHNQEMRGRNPQGNKPDRSRSERKEGDTF
ncbi:MAG: hypothetical protein LC785_14025 [Acidobacteria bacterium]|nr:hypothetical protein [Acidobacteriota bacterium]MCA1643031.1 hypothetical protein [Acidobacteriota bacterium]